MRRCRSLVENNSSSEELMELGDDYVEEVTGGNGDDEITSSEHEGGNLPRKNPFIQYCQEQTKMATKFLQKNKVELTEELRKRMTKIVAKDWKALPMKKQKQSAAQTMFNRRNGNISRIKTRL